MIIKSVNDAAFKAYGRVLNEYDFSNLIEAMKDTEAPADSTIYVPSDEKMETLPGMECLLTKLYGNLPAQVGYCNGFNKYLNALEYHRSSEINVAVSDVILLVGKLQDVKDDYTYDTSNVEAFLVPEGTAVEVYATTLHYAPCSPADGPFRCVVILPKDTNTELEYKPEPVGEDKLITAKNKWLIAHADAKIEGAFAGLIGENISV